MDKLKVGDKVRIISKNSRYFNCLATIVETNKSNISYFCELKDYNGEIIRNWYIKIDIDSHSFGKNRID